MLELRSHFSFGHGAHSVSQLAEGLREAGWNHFPLCDRSGLYGMVELQRACGTGPDPDSEEASVERSALKPILGASFPELGGLLAFARNPAGQRELNRLVTLSQLGPGWELRPPEGWAERDTPLELDRGDTDSPAGHRSRSCAELRAACLELRDCELVLPTEEALQALLPAGKRADRPAGDCLSLGIDPERDRRKANQLWQLAREWELPLIPHQQTDYLTGAEDAALHRRIRAMDRCCSLERLEREGDWNARGSLPDYQAFRAPYSRAPEILKRLDAVVERCALELETGSFHLPQLPGVRKGSETAILRRLCLQGLARRYPAPGPWRRRGRDGKPGSVGESSLATARERLERELRVVEELGFSGYFLVVREIVEYVRARNMPMIGRGSAANSLVSYCLGFTEVDPIRHRLSFERFLNPWRSTPPDIDLDFSWTDRDDVFRHVFRRFGAEHVAMLCTTITLGPRGALRELAKVEGLSGPELDSLCRTFPRGRHDWEDELREHPERYGLAPGREPLHSLVPWIRRLEGLPRHLGIHVGGILITPRPLTDYLPLQRAGRGVTVTQLDMHPVEELGLLKIDLLAQRGLGVYQDLIRLEASEARLARETGKPAPETCPRDVYELEREAKTASLMREGRSMGCFYVESPGMQALLRKLRCDSFEDLIAASSIIRPGVSESGMMQAYVERHRQARELPPEADWPFDFLHERMRELLEDTYGIMVYQEDVMHVVSGLASMTLAEGDLLRRAMSGKGVSRATMLGFRDRFMQGSEANGIPAETALEVWRQIASFAGYAFCKAHSASFAVLSYRVAWFKAHRPAEFMAAVLNNEGGFFSAAAYVQETRRLGLHVLAPCLLQGRDSWSSAPGQVRTGLRAVRALSRESRRLIQRERESGKWSSFSDFRCRCPLRREELEQLVFSGACDELAGGGDPRSLRPALLWELRSRQPRPGREHAPELGLEIPMERPRSVGHWSWIDCWRHERESLGFGLCRHPLELFDFEGVERECVTSTKLHEHVGGRVKMIGWKFAQKGIRTRNEKKRMAFLSLEDTHGTWEAVLFPESWERHALLLRQSGPFVLEGRVEMEAEEPMLQVDWMASAGKLSERHARNLKPETSLASFN